MTDEEIIQRLRLPKPWEAYTLGERFQLKRLIPCTVRCFRCGGPTDLDKDNRCGECSEVWSNEVLEEWSRPFKE